MNRISSVLLLLFLIFVPLLSNASEGTFSSEIDSLFHGSSNTPGCMTGIIHRSEFIHLRGYGLANLEHNIPIEADTVFRTGSLSKQFTATAVALLSLDGKVDLDEDIRDYLPELFAYDSKVTVRQIVHHIGGMGNYDHPIFTKENGEHFRFGNRDFWTIEEFYEQVRQAPLERPPGKEFDYSNLGYVVLAMLVERISDQSLAQFLDARIFSTLDMSNSLFNDNVNQLIPKRADGYKVKEGITERFDTNLSWVGDGGLYTTMNDILKWDRFFYDPGPPGMRDVVDIVTLPHDQATVASLGYEGKYAFGAIKGTYQGTEAHFHSGHWVGFSSFYVRNPDLRLSTVVLCNGTNHDAPHVAAEIYKLVLEHLE